MMVRLKDIFFIVVLSCLFTVVIYIVDIYFFEDSFSEEQYIEPTLPVDFLEIKWGETSQQILEKTTDLIHTHTWTVTKKSDIHISQQILEKFRKLAEEKKIRDTYTLSYIPVSFQEEAINYGWNAAAIITSQGFLSKIESLLVELYEESYEVRWKMKEGKVQMFGVADISSEEFTSVFIHELSHYIDIYYFSESKKQELSPKFYNISWDSTKILKPWSLPEEFVSWYAMTNKYEDFAETFTYYVLHNKDFLEKAKGNAILQKKYNFFQQNVFEKDMFLHTDFSENSRIEKYYWDITKIPINIDIFLQYLKNEI